LINRIARQCFERSLLVEIAGRRDGVMKISPALTIPDEILAEGLEVLTACVDAVLEA
jgi:diaminobutyrate-2-oxoglutarate transaminase